MDGQLVSNKAGRPAEPEPCAGNDGTTIIVSGEKGLFSVTFPYDHIGGKPLLQHSYPSFRSSKQLGGICTHPGCNDQVRDSQPQSCVPMQKGTALCTPVPFASVLMVDWKGWLFISRAVNTIQLDRSQRYQAVVRPLHLQGASRYQSHLSIRRR